jgi:pimeloyl-ACP methyl ester carboxylesterase
MRTLFPRRAAAFAFAGMLASIAPAAQAPQAVSGGDPLRRAANPGWTIDPPGPQAWAVVKAVEPGGAAAAAGLRAGDSLFAIDGRRIDTGTALEDTLFALRAGQQPRLEILRDGRPMTLEIELPPLPLEQIPGVDVELTSVLSDKGHRLRTVVTRPKGMTGRRPGLFLAGWLSCDSVEIPVGPPDGFNLLLRGLAAKSGFVTMRMDKPGIGDSEGPACSALDFETELAGYRAAFRAFRARPDVDPDRILVIGMSNGGGYGPLVTGDFKAAGFIASGGWSKTWLEHMLEVERRRLTLRGDAPGVVSAKMKGTAELYDRYLNGRRMPGDVIRDHPHLAPLWPGDPVRQYGRPAEFYWQLQGLNLGEVWSKVDVPTLALWGEHDWVMSREDHELIAALVNKNRPGAGTFRAVSKMNHGYLIHDTLEQSFRDSGSGKFHEGLVDEIVAWMKEAVK